MCVLIIDLNINVKFKDTSVSNRFSQYNVFYIYAAMSFIGDPRIGWFVSRGLTKFRSDWPILLCLRNVPRFSTTQNLIK